MGRSTFGIPTILQAGNLIGCPYCGGVNRVKVEQRSAVCDGCKQIFTFFPGAEAERLVEPVKMEITPERVNQLRQKWVESDSLKENPHYEDFRDLWRVIERLQISFERERSAAEALRERLHDRGDEV